MRDVEVYSAPDACRVAGISYRQLDYWCRSGVVVPAVPATGSGSQRGYTHDQIVDLAVVADLTAANRPLEVARWLLAGRDWLQGCVRITVDRHVADALVAERLATYGIRPRHVDVDLRVAAGRAALPPLVAAARPAVSS